MNKGIDIIFANLNSKEDDIRFNALTTLKEISKDKVPWFEERYNELISKLNDSNSFQRSIGIMLLCDLAKSDENQLINKDLAKILRHIQDEKFITSRQCIQNIWKIAIYETDTRSKIEKALIEYFARCESIDHGNLLRQDIISALWEIRKTYNDPKLEKTVIQLIELENDKNNIKRLQSIIK
jgi:hypothetical protein